MTTNQDLKNITENNYIAIKCCMAENVLMITRIDFIIYHSEFSLSINLSFVFLFLILFRLKIKKD